ncbi:uncharacterized protein LOC143905715 isoform X2 [Temnothorax americanus]|uniref:uncharacterized protein LOC143905715 isoform X2 n=1 Tax=Temnothorax americanus TaxID=1964332 RepID=UPI004068E801
MPSCAVKSCRSYTGKKGSENLRFFRFPADPVMSEQWKVIYGNENINVKNARICSLHFHANAYKEASWIQSVLGAGHTPKKTRKLRTDAIPTECLELILNQVPDETPTAQSTCIEEQSIISVPDETPTFQSTCTEGQSNVVEQFNDSSYSQLFDTDVKGKILKQRFTKKMPKIISPK